MRVTLAAAALLAVSAAGAQTLNGPESTEVHARTGRVFVSNKNAGQILVRATDGMLSVFTDDPTSPYGIELLGGVLYVVDSGNVRGYDIDTAVRVLNEPIAGASFLNGITSNGVDTLYVTDFSAKKVTALDISNLAAPMQTPLATTTQTPNGIVYDVANQRLLIATWGSNAKVLALSPAGGTPTILIDTAAPNTPLNNIDGIALDCRGAIYVTPWTCPGGGGCLRRFDPPFTTTSPPVAVGPALSSPADIDYGKFTGDIAIPESGGNRVTLVPTGCGGVLFADDFER